ncbi:MAG: Hsp70 family protein [Rhodoferax sp.]|uniref:Hsp70 family protein n=1 Tax=Rhodoferax sp. TaxID=50421 RepID=UPI002728ED41|nr:Hsp70 family protein [Rhodoferax sp.]MDO8448106.1 Hsp70 family protein [Rhodoferax sp.]
MVLGIDFGTSNSAAALVGADGQLCVIPLDGASAAMPTALFFCNETHTTLFGTQAMQAYLGGTEGRLMRSIKSLLGSRLMDEYTVVNGQSIRFFDIVVLFFKELKARCEAHVGHPIERAMLGRPVHFVDDDAERDALAQATLGRAAREAGFAHIDFQLEPIAAAFDFEQRIARETTALVVDIGGGTSDFTVIRLGPDLRQKSDRSSDILATTGVHLGGTDFDRLLDLGYVMPLLGYRHIGPGERPIPNSVFFDLSTWHLIHHAYSRKSMHFARELWTSYADLALHARLMQVLEEHHGHRILAGVEAAKIACSISQDNAAVDLAFLHTPNNALPAPPVVITPHGMGEALAGSLTQVVQCALQCVQASGLAAVDVVYLTGGSSALQPLVDALKAALPGATMVQGDRFGGVAAGLAWAGSVADKG